MRPARIVETRHVQAGGQLVITLRLGEGRQMRIIGGKPARRLNDGRWYDSEVEKAAEAYRGRWR